MQEQRHIKQKYGDKVRKHIWRQQGKKEKELHKSIEIDNTKCIQFCIKNKTELTDKGNYISTKT